jgi:hypothetical protein
MGLLRRNAFQRQLRKRKRVTSTIAAITPSNTPPILRYPMPRSGWRCHAHFRTERYQADQKEPDLFPALRALTSLRLGTQGPTPPLCPGSRITFPVTNSTCGYIPRMAKRIHRRRDVTPAQGLRKYGRTTFADPVNKKYPIDTPGRIKAAWAYIHQPSNAAKYSASERRTIMSRIRKAAKAGGVRLPDPDEFVELMARVRRRKQKGR